MSMDFFLVVTASHDYKYWTPRRDCLAVHGSAISKRLGGRTENPGREHRVKCEQVSGGSTYLERMRYPRAGGADQIDNLGLKYHVSKQDYGNSLRSVVRHDRARESHDDPAHRTPAKDPFLLIARENMSGSQLQGTIKVPRRSTDFSSSTDRGRHLGRGSSERPINEISSKFAHPESIAMLKVKNRVNYEHVNNRQLPGKRKRSEQKGVDQKGERSLSFEGPKPLSEILKRKRSAGAAYHESGITPGTSEVTAKQAMSYKHSSTLFLVLLIMQATIFSQYVDAGKKRVHITNDLDDVVDNEEDEAWKEWGRKKSSPDLDLPDI
ncbi:hypothetical protein AgCh_029506 [Apium graveolens]